MAKGFERYSKKTRRAEFLEEMEQVVPWGKLCALIEPHYPKAGIHGMLGFVRQMRPIIFHLRNPRVSIMRIHPILIASFVLPPAV